MSFSKLAPLVDRPGILSCGELRTLNLGFLKDTDLFGCLECPEFHLLSLSTCAKHIHKHMDNARDIPSREIKRILQIYGAFEGLLSEYDLPSEPIKPYPALPRREAFSCDLCYEKKEPFFTLSYIRCRDHFTTDHPQKAKASIRDNYISQICVQTFCSGWNNSKFLFEVKESMAVDVNQDAFYETRDATLAELSQTMRDRFTTAETPKSTGESLKDTQPAIYWTGWAAHVQDHDTEFLLDLIEYPGAAKGELQADLLHGFANEVQEVFFAEQRELNGRSGILRRVLSDTGSGPNKEFKKLEPTVAKSYARLLSLWVCFVLRLFEQQSSGDDRYPVTFTKRQKEACAYVLQWCHTNQRAQDLGVRYLLLRMARAFWAPEHLEEAFRHLEKDQLDDPTTRFACLINLKVDGTFQSPSTMSHNLTMMKYIIRQMLLAWSIDRAEHLTNDGNPTTAHSILLTLDRALADDQLTPFAHICLASSHAARYAYTTSSLPNVMWTSQTSLIVEGSAIDFRDYTQMLVNRLEQLEDRVLGKAGLLMGLPPAKMNFNITETTKIHDNLAETRLGYSFLTDEKNPFLGMQFNLIDAIFEHRRGRLIHGIHKAADGKASITWNEKDVNNWSSIYDECSQEFNALIHAVGGQPARGVESCLVKLVNTPYRVRGVYFLRPGVLVFVLLYSKTTSITGLDRVVAHAVPWRIGRLFLIMIALARPLAGILVERSRGALARVVQETSAFPIRGEEMTSAQLSDRIREWFIHALGVSIGIRVFRHFVIACQRKLMPEAFEIIKQAMAVVDTQAGHTSDTANSFYAVDASETHLLSPTTVSKNVSCSLEWHRKLFPPTSGVLSQKEINDGKSHQENTHPNVTPNSTIHPPAPGITQAQVTQAVTEAFENGKLLHSLSTLLGRTVADIIIAAGVTTTNRSQMQRPPAKLVEAKHLVLLERYQCNPHATWRSVGQAQAIVQILARNHSLLVVLPTGGGKSFLFGSLPLIESGFTLVLFPYTALFTDQLREAREHQQLLIQSDEQRGRKLVITEWKEGLEQDAQTGLVGVSVDTFVQNKFQEWFIKQIINRRVNRVVFDEVHTAVTQADFRPCMHELEGLTRQGVPIVCLSATMPPSMEDELCVSLGHPRLTVIREPTQRPNIEYHIARYSSEKHAKLAFKKQIQHFESKLHEGEGILVVCRTNKEVNEWANTLNAYGYSSETTSKNPQEAAQNLEIWTSGQFKILVGTTAVGTGVNHKHVRVVAHWGRPYGPIDFQQESGRAGRDGRPAISLIFCWDPRFPYTSPPTNGEAVMDYVLDTDECVRLLMSKWLDGDDLATSCSGGIGLRKCFRCQIAHRRALNRDGTALAGPDQFTNTNRYWAPDKLVLHEIPRAPISHIDDNAQLPLKSKKSFNRATQEMVAALPPLLEPPAPIGEAVLADKRGADARATVSTRELMELRQASASTVTRAAPYCLDALMQAKQFLSGKCVWCVLNKEEKWDHNLSVCKHTMFRTWEMEGFNFKGISLKEAKCHAEFPRQEGICFYCWWPSQRAWNHNYIDYQNPDCNIPDAVQQIVWWYLISGTQRERMIETFGIHDKGNDTRIYFTWLSEIASRESRGGKICALTNAQRVVIWALFVDLRVCDFV